MPHDSRRGGNLLMEAGRWNMKVKSKESRAGRKLPSTEQKEEAWGGWSAAHSPWALIRLSFQKKKVRFRFKASVDWDR
ncbi:hypothetical protein KP509_16G024200 [Ceratopteris richardii]|uniref:Uncharacterized protein n=1 Tax=Ceratopteris richardii TaxID=49495 RepID=A0A8T2SZD6_CERRI|nr:hypothetical protein KP509_16G024200 [Ceratopteris richardii]